MGLIDEEKNAESSEELKGQTLSRKNSHSSFCPTEDEEEDEDRKLELGPMIALKEQLEKDKDDESLRRWKEQLLGTIDLEEVGETHDPVVKILTLTLRSPEREDMVLRIPEDGTPVDKGPWFTLKEGAKYTLVSTFRVTNNIVSGLQYSNSVWRTGLKVYSRKEMLGTFSPQAEPYEHVMLEALIPLNLSLSMTITSVTWRTITPSTFARIGQLSLMEEEKSLCILFFITISFLSMYYFFTSI